MEKTGEIVWAHITDEKMKLLKENEKTMGAKVLVAFSPEKLHYFNKSELNKNEWKLATLDNSQLESLKGLEQKLGAIVIAYQTVV